jgi:hypothetical protein
MVVAKVLLAGNDLQTPHADVPAGPFLELALRRVVVHCADGKAKRALNGKRNATVLLLSTHFRLAAVQATRHPPSLPSPLAEGEGSRHVRMRSSGASIDRCNFESLLPREDRGEKVPQEDDGGAFR